MWPRHRHRPWLLIVGAAAALLALPFLVAGTLLLLVEPAMAPDEYVEAVAGEPPLLNPVLAPYTLAGQDVLPLVFAALVRTDAAGNVELDLAERLDVDEDGRAYVARLRDGLLWDDGEPLTAEDVAFTVRLIQAPGPPGQPGARRPLARRRGRGGRSAHGPIPTADAAGLVCRASDARPAAPPCTGRCGRFGASRSTRTIASRLAAAHTASPRSTPGGWCSSGTRRYHGPRPRLSRIELRVYGERAAALQAVRHREVDGLAGLRPEETEQISSSGQYVVYAVPERSKTAAVIFNLESPILREPAVRAALARAVDREALIRDALGRPAAIPRPGRSPSSRGRMPERRRPPITTRWCCRAYWMRLAGSGVRTASASETACRSRSCWRRPTLRSG